MSNLVIMGDFTGGETSIYPYLSMAPKYSMKMQNCHVSESGGIAKMPGYSRINLEQVGPRLTSGFEYMRMDGTSTDLVAGGGSVFIRSGNSLQLIKSGLDPEAKIWFAQMHDLVVFGNGVDDPHKYNGSSVSALRGIPTATTFTKPHTHLGRIWWTDAQNRMMAYHSALQAPEDYTTGRNSGYIDFSYVLPHGDQLLDIITYVDLLVFLFKQHIAIYSGTNPTMDGDFRMVQLISGTGVIAPNCALPVGTDLLFCHTSGIRSLKQSVANGNMEIGAVSKKVETAIQKSIKLGSDLSNPFAVAHYPRRGWAMFLINGEVWVYSYVWNAWGRMTGANISGMFNRSDDSVCFTGAGYVYEYGTCWSFDGTPMAMQWDGAWLPFGKRGSRGFPKLLELTCGQGVDTLLDIIVTYDQNPTMGENIISSVQTMPGPSFMDTAVNEIWERGFIMDSPAEFSAIRVPLFGSGKGMQLSISNISQTGPIEWNHLLVDGTVGAS